MVVCRERVCSWWCVERGCVHGGCVERGCVHGGV